MPNRLLKYRVEELASDAAQRGNAIALLSALDGTALAEIESEDISLNPYTNAICFDWLVSGEWDSLQVEIYSDHFETYLSRDQELRINHWACDPRSPALENVIEELLAGTVQRPLTTPFLPFLPSAMFTKSRRPTQDAIAHIRLLRQHRIVNSSLFLSKAADAADLAAWSSILPAQSRVLRTNLFGDVFLLDDAGAVHMLERAGCSIDRIAFSEEEFWRELRDDAHGWQLRGLVSECQSAGKLPKEDQCYAFTTPPILGGDYTVENVWVAPWRDWFAFTADLFEQIKDLPDGATVSLKVVDQERQLPTPFLPLRPSVVCARSGPADSDALAAI